MQDKDFENVQAFASHRLKVIGKRIRHYRRVQGWTQQELAYVVQPNLSPVVISRYEKGKSDMQVTTYLSLAQALDVTPSELADWKTSTPAQKVESSGYEFLSPENQRIVDKITHALLIEQEKSNRIVST